jgi:hypothetical protein
VIINVNAVRGPHDRGALERAARLAWGRIVRCYNSSGRGERGMIALNLEVAGAGKVIGARHTQSTLKSEQLALCMTRAMVGLSMPKARAGSTVSTEIQVGPGDPQ